MFSFDIVQQPWTWQQRSASCLLVRFDPVVQALCVVLLCCVCVWGGGFGERVVPFSNGLSLVFSLPPKKFYSLASPFCVLGCLRLNLNVGLPIDRLDTILDSDRVCVMDAGRVVEYDAPDVLLKNEDSIFSGLVREMRERASGN